MVVPAPELQLPETASLDSIAGTLAALPPDGPESIGRNLDLVSWLGQPERIARLLSGVLRDSALLAKIAGTSYRHVNRFDKIVLVDSGCRLGYRLTLHLWCPPYTDDELQDELIHDHRFSFWSTILTGDLVSQNFEHADDGQVFRQYRYIPEKLAASTVANFYRFVGQARLRTNGLTVERAGGSYHLWYERVHRVMLPQEAMTCTLVLRGPRRRDFSNIFNTSYPDQNTRATNVMFTPDQLASKLSALRSTIARTRGA